MKAISIIIIILLIIGIGIFFVYNSFAKLDIVDAQLHVESGEVKVDDVLVTGNVKLKQGSTIETLDGLATVILYESILISLSQNTIVTLEDLVLNHPRVMQEKGKTWNTFTKLYGVQDYTITSGNSIASVRATAFLLTVNKIITGEGVVDYIINEKSFIVPIKKVVEKINGEIIERDATPEEIEEIKENIRRSIKELQYLRQLEFDKNKALIDKVKQQYGITDEEFEESLERADNGLIDVDEVFGKYESKLPIKIGAITKVKETTKSIQELNKQLNEL